MPEEAYEMIAETEPGGAGRRYRANFVVMALCFSLNHGCVTALIALASSELGPSVGNTSSGILYLVYTVTAALFSTALTTVVGARRTLTLGLWIYCGYIGSYVVALACAGAVARRVAVYSGATLGGVAAGILWPAQGRFYAVSAERYADGARLTRPTGNAILGGDFATLYLGAEVAMKLLASLVTHTAHPPALATRVLFVAYTAIAAAAASAISFVEDVEDTLILPASSSSSSSSSLKDRLARLDVGQKASAALRLFLTDPMCACLFPTNFAFGLAAALLNGYFMSSVVAPGLGVANIGYVSAIVVGTAALAAKPLGFLAAKLGSQLALTVLGSAAFAFFALAVLRLSGASLATWAAVAPLVALFGVGRSTWENNFKATVADYFPEEKTAAFANIQLQSGLASTIGFFLTSNAANARSPTLVGTATLATALLAVVGQGAAALLHRHGQRAQALGRYSGDESTAVEDDGGPASPTTSSQALLQPNRRGDRAVV